MKGIGLLGPVIASSSGDQSFIALLALGILILVAYAVEQRWL